ncbi:NAD(P)-dependent oxidoreductase [Candidatus Methylacidiphilum infernorum]|uniref:NAD(P)-dependent oxidoreductase n=1 Tax=Candidatus Methylacidiphilum infernorum TaxID=511746 RepID=A0ABX7PTR5_9BACT|nr:NAD(P)-dependent oxidoreductase [Candidatus Methylacidiphilum infernorum]QSR86375.1 NAD(P)-dependent oxidoreductase [Candidatus Methylacidiphilum infernorum]
MKKILVTGSRGYIGVHLVALCKAYGMHVTGCDIGYFEGCEWDPFPPSDVEWKKDFLSIKENELEGFDAICHLAAISNDPMGELDENLTYRVNRDGAISLAQKAKKAGVPLFLFAGSCSVYGKAGSLDLDENAPFNPVSAYARSKVEAEREISKLSSSSFSPVFLRNATAFGYSPMLRIDLVANNLLSCALATREIRVMSDGTPWRPLVHCKDIARAFIALIQAPRQLVHNQSINIGGNNENYQVKQIVEKVKSLVPDAKVVYTGEVGADPRNYRVSFDKLSKLLPDFKLQYSLDSGLEELYKFMKEKKFSREDFFSDKFVRLRRLKQKLQK